MALTCDAFAAGFLRDFACAIQSSGACTPSRTLTCDEVMLLMAFVLHNIGGLSPVADITSEDLETVVKNALCAFQSVAIPPIDRDKLVAFALYMANETYCG